MRDNRYPVCIMQAVFYFHNFWLLNLKDVVVFILRDGKVDPRDKKGIYRHISLVIWERLINLRLFHNKWLILHLCYKSYELNLCNGDGFYNWFFLVKVKQLFICLYVWSYPLVTQSNGLPRPIFLVIDQYISSPCNLKADFIVYLQALKSNWFDNYFILIMWIWMGKSKFYVEGSENFPLFPFTLETLSINPVKRSFNEFLHYSSNLQFYRAFKFEFQIS